MDLTNPSKFGLLVGEVRAIAPCVSFVLFLDETSDEGILEFYERSMAALDGLITHYVTGDAGRRSRFSGRALTMVPTWLEHPRPGKDYFIEFFGCDRDQGVTGAAIELVIRRRPPLGSGAALTPQEARRKTADEDRQIIFGKLATILRVCLPLEHPLAQPGRLLEWVLEFQLVRAWPFLSGYCGLALNHYSSVASSIVRRAMQAQLASFCLRYPGFDWLESGPVASKLLRYQREMSAFLPLVKRVNWLTLLCNRTIEYLGGGDALRRRLGNDLAITAHEREAGLVIQAGAAPELGDVAHRDFIPAYRRVAEVIRPARLEKIVGPGAGFSDDAANEWLNAFDKQYE